MSDTNTRVIIDVTLNSEDSNKKAQELGNSIKAIKAEQKALKDQGKETDAAYVSNAATLRQLTQEQKAYVTMSNNAEGSNNLLRAQLSLLTQQYNALGKEERDNTVAGKALQVQIKGLSDEIKTNEEKVGDHRRSVGDYAKANRDATETIKAQGDELKTMGGIVSQAPIGFQILGTQIGNVKNQLTNFRQATQEAKVAQLEYQAAQKIATEATEASKKASQEAASIGFKFASAQKEATEAVEASKEALETSIAVGERYVAGEITAAEAEAARIAALEAKRLAEIKSAEASRLQTAATASQVVATDTAIVAEAAHTTAIETQTAATAAATNATRVFKIALASTGIGAIIILVAGLVTYLSKFDPVMDKIEQAFAGFGAAVDVVMGSIVDFVSNITSVKDLMSKMGQFLLHPIDSFSKLGDEISKAAKATMALTKAQQDLEDQNKMQEVSNARSLQQVKQLTLAARNRSLSEKERQKLLADASKLDQQNFNERDELVKKEIELAQRQIVITAGLNEKGIKLLKERGLAYAYELKDRKRITDEMVNVLQQAQIKESNILQEATNRDEKRQNDADASAERAAQAEEKRQGRMQKAREENAAAEKERLESFVRANENLISERQRDVDALNREIDAKVVQYRKYGATTEQLERERVARLKQINDQYNKEEIANIKAINQQVEDLMISRVMDAGERELMQIATNNQRKLEQQDEFIQQTKDRIQRGEEGLTELLLAQQNLRDQMLASNQYELDTKQREINLERDQEEAERIKMSVERDRAAADARGKIQDEQRELMLAGVDLLATIFGKETELGKMAFVAQKAFAIAQIVIDTQRALAANRLAEQTQNAAYALIPFWGQAAAIANSIAKQAERTRLIVAGAISGATIAATAIQGLYTGGVFETDGKGSMVKGPGTGTSDSVNAKLSNGESVINAKSTKMFLPILSMINEAGGGVPLKPSYSWYTGNTVSAAALAAGGIAQSMQGGHISDTVRSIEVTINPDVFVEAVRSLPAPIVDVQEFTTVQMRSAQAKVNANL